MISKYMYDEPAFLGPHWEPGREIVSRLYADIPWPSDKSEWDLNSRQRVRWTGEADEEALVLKKDVTWTALEGKPNRLPRRLSILLNLSSRVP
jgi:hypothetical protein